MDKVKSRVEITFQNLKDGIIAYGRRMYLLEDETLKGKYCEKPMNRDLQPILGVQNCIGT
jgi:hypothetical protein